MTSKLEMEIGKSIKDSLNAFNSPMWKKHIERYSDNRAYVIQQMMPFLLKTAIEKSKNYQHVDGAERYNITIQPDQATPFKVQVSTTDSSGEAYDTIYGITSLVEPINSSATPMTIVNGILRGVNEINLDNWRNKIKHLDAMLPHGQLARPALIFAPRDSEISTRDALRFKQNPFGTKVVYAPVETKQIIDAGLASLKNKP